MYKLNYFNFKERPHNYLLTNDLGNFIFLSKNNFQKLINHHHLEEKVYNELVSKKFIYTKDREIFSKEASLDLRKFKNERLNATSLHIFVVSKNCNFNCIYCQAGDLSQKEEFMMDEKIAMSAVNIALQSPAKHLSFEFQGGEPLTNFKIIKFIVLYTEEHKKNKEIDYTIVSNLSLLSNEMIDFFTKYNISISTSIDGNKKIQLFNRPFMEGNSYDIVIKKLKQLQDRNIGVGAIETTSRISLKNYKEIIDEYVKNKLNIIYIRPLTRLGKAGKNWSNIGYTAEEFLDFYKKSLDYILALNKKGIDIAEGHSLIFLKKILYQESVNYMELRSPCGGAIGQLAYYYDGNIYTCDEGRMLSEMGDDSFCLGNVLRDNYKDLMQEETTKIMCISSCLESLPYCHSCVYSPYCGVCPVLNLALDNSIFSKNPHEYRCKIYGGMLDILFEYLEQDKENEAIFRKWLN